jgi:pSer/pThr/pTyr-binding forkhead associated (FHA) protein
MQTCQNCLLQNYNGTIFCDTCGADLLKQQPAKPEKPFPMHTNTETSSTADGDNQAGETTQAVTLSDRAQHTNPLVQLVLGDGQQVKLMADTQLIIGRKNDNSKNSHTPDVDLAPYNGYDAGVSRRHAVISWHDSGYVLQDLKSLNGTFVNNTRLQPGEAVVISNGDYVQFGTLRAQFRAGSMQRATSTSMRAA